ncbi:MAG: hypothetical protein GFH27_549293n78 [Chloroflexi bacterium AL-W]|nr:hypothetical protein [Chloroflexi bacterium AL-N1]NOK67807.1 hypothetical protein [Chloroflexi bacterium AL-N10]NOK75423.1 hypothetical protein [Chloroflexi bacterium AL-N5]NOK82211.1 hypothetical protein [Chloroflexi bacterium AL-W]NOK90056.1 hypothetical protein [Chloroflexi bacterium AL-N15]
MIERWAGITTSSKSLILVIVEYDDNGPTVIDDLTWNLQDGPRPHAYRLMYERVVNYLRETSIQHVLLKATALNTRGIKAAHLDAAELRGVVMVAAVQSESEVKVVPKALVSRTFGNRNVDDYIADNDFWINQISGNLRKGSREAALLILAARK